MQPLTLILLPLLGQQRIAPLRSAADVPHGGEALSMDPRLILSLGFVAIGIAIIFFFRRITPRTLNDGKLLFSEICSRHHLSNRQQKLLLEMARQKQLACPSHFLMDASLWSPDSEQPPRWESPNIQDEMVRLRSLLFTHSDQGELHELPA